MKKLFNLILALILGWVGVGVVYSLSGYWMRSIGGREEVFNPLVGIPMDILGWYWGLRASLAQGDWNAQVIATVAALVIALIIILKIASQKSS